MNDTTTPSPEDEPTRPERMLPAPSSAGSLNIGAHDFEVILANHYDDHASDVLRYWFFTAKKLNWNLGRLARATGLSTTTLHRLFRGEYGAKPGSAIATLDAVRATFAESADNPDFIETSLAKRMYAAFDKTRALKTVTILWGRLGIGKSVIAKEYIRTKPIGQTMFVRVPAGASFAVFVKTVARALGVARGGRTDEIRERIIQLLAMGQRLLIVDELHQAFLTMRGDTSVKVCEFLREIQDESQCGMVLIGTEVLEEHIFRGPHKAALEQLVDRGTIQIPLPQKATQPDIRKFLDAYGLDFPDSNQSPDAARILNDIIRSAGLRKLTIHLRDGKAFANKREESFTWDHFVAAYDAIQALKK